MAGNMKGMNFNNTFTFVGQKDWQFGNIPENDRDEQDIYMMEQKAMLNGLKEKLSVYNLREWSRHTIRMNPASKIVKTVGSTIKPRPFCSNAWCKFYELIVTLRLVEDLDLRTPLHSVHLCEAPGGFVCALNHFIHSEMRGLEYQWLANTLNPYHERCRLGEMVPDDRLIRHTLDRWLYGLDNTGDLTKLSNIDHIISQSKHNLGHKIQLVTADGSLDCQLSPSEQEMIVYPLILCEIFTAISLLDCGGTAVIKMFTTFESHSISLMFLLCLLFKTVHLHKPVNSKPGNSEVYVVCKSRVETIPNNTLTLLRDSISSGEPVIKFSSIPETFLLQIRAAADQFKSSQMNTISTNIAAFSDNNLIPVISNEKNAQDFIQKMRLRSIDRNQSVVQTASFFTHHHRHRNDVTINSYGNETKSLVWQPRKRRLSGNFSERSQQTAENRLTELMSSDKQPTQSVKYLHNIETTSADNHSPLDALRLVNVITIPRAEISTNDESRVYNSCFCEGKLLSDYNVLADTQCDIISEDIQSTDLHDIEEFTLSSLEDFHVMINISSQVCHEAEVSSPRLVVSSDMTSNLQHFHQIFQIIRSDDSLLLHNMNCINRLGAGVVFLLWHSFDEVAVAGHNSTNCRPSILFKRCILSDQERTEYSEHLKSLLNPILADDNTKVLTVVSTPDIIKCTSLHSTFLCDINNETLRRGVNKLIMIQRESQQGTGAGAPSLTT